MSDIEFHATSWTDPGGRLFWRDGRLFRGVFQSRAPLYRSLWERGVIDRLIEQELLVDTKMVDWTVADFALVLEHRKVPAVTYPSEWCGAQLKAAALLILDLELALRPHGLTVMDICPWNLLFDAHSPRWVDFCSIVPLADGDAWSSRQQFEEFYLAPLRLFGEGLHRMARRMLFDPWQGITAGEANAFKAKTNQARAAELAGGISRRARALVPDPARPVLRNIASAVRRASAKKPEAPRSVVAQLTDLKQEVEAASPDATTTAWAGFYRENFPEFTPGPGWTAKHRSMNEIFERFKPASVLDIGANRGWYSRLAAKHGAAVIAADSDETSINELYRDSRAARLPITSVVMDVRFPEPACGPGYRMFPSAAERMRSDMVLALAIVHHLVFLFQLNFGQVVEMVSLFVKRHLVIEFVGPRDPVVQRYGVEKYPWYSHDRFVAALRERFRIVEELPSDSGGLDDQPHERVLYVCEKTS